MYPRLRYDLSQVIASHPRPFRIHLFNYCIIMKRCTKMSFIKFNASPVSDVKNLNNMMTI